MDAHRFDRLARRFGVAASRRAVLAAIGAGLGATVGGAGMAAQRGGQGRCRTDKQCDWPQHCDDGRCRNPPGGICDRKRCFGAECANCNTVFDYDRFEACVGDRNFCEFRREGCCGFCAKWAGNCTCCS